MIVRGLLTAAVALVCQIAVAAELPTARAQSVGMSAERLEAIAELTREYVDAGKLAGAVTMVARRGRIVHFEAVGKQDLSTGEAMSKDTLFRIYSMSKPITAVAAMILYEEGAFQLGDPITKFLPELKGLMVYQEAGEPMPLESPITMQQLLTHTAGFSYGFDQEDPVDRLYREKEIFGARDLDDFVARIAEIPLRYEPGTRWHYSVAVDLTGAIVERISGQRFDRFLEARLFEPLDMHDTFFDIPEDKRDRFGTNHRWDREKQELVVLPTPEYPLWQDTTFFSGGGGLVSTARDYMRFAEMLRNGGALDGVRILGPKTVEFMTMNHLPATLSATGSGEAPGASIGREARGFGFGLGFGIVTDVAENGVIGSVGEYNWGGAAGTVFWVDPVEEIVVVAMIQLMGSPWPLRAELKALTYGAITELE